MEKYYLNAGTYYAVAGKRPINIPAQLHRSLNEELHVFQRDNKNLEDDIRRSYNYGVDAYGKQSTNTMKIFHDDVDYIKCPDFYLETNKTPKTKIQMFIGFSNIIPESGAGLNVCIPINVPNLLNVPLQTLYWEINGRPVLCSVIITLPTSCNNILKNNQKNIGIIKHELLHVFHRFIKKDFAINNGKAFYYANELAKSAGEAIPDAKVLDDLVVYPPDDFTLLLIYSAAIYYLDDSERQAWLQSFDSYDKFYRAPGDLRNFRELMPYQTYKNLYTALEYYQDELMDIKNNINPNNEKCIKCLDIIQNWADDTKYYINARLIKKWLLNCKQWFKNADAIHCNNNS